MTAHAVQHADETLRVLDVRDHRVLGDLEAHALRRNTRAIEAVDDELEERRVAERLAREVDAEAATRREPNAVTASLDAQVQIAEDGQIDLTALFDDTDVGQVNISIASDQTGEVQEAPVLDPAAQPEVSVGIAAFIGCDGLSLCNEDLVLRFDRLEADVTNELEFEWELDGFVSILDEEAEQIGTLTFTPE